MEQLFQSILLLSCVGGVLTGVLLLLKPLTQKVFGSCWQFCVWLCVLAVMLLPVRFDLPAHAVPVPQPQAVEVLPLGAAVQIGVAIPSAPVMPSPVRSVTASTMPKLAPDILAVLPALWLFGAFLSLGWAILQYLRFIHITRIHSQPIQCPELDAVKGSLHIRRNIRVRSTDCTTASLMVGLFRSTLLLPNGAMEEGGLRDILRHELTHVKRCDIACKWFALLVRCVHWFNPLVYFLCNALDETCEISCDLAVTEKMDAEEKRGYMRTILSLASPQNLLPLATSMAGRKSQIERRFTMIQISKKPSRLVSVLSVITAIALLSTSVFASGVAASAAGIGPKEKRVIEVYQAQIKVELTNKPLIDGGVAYLPLRETLTTFGLPNEAIRWERDQSIHITASDGATFVCTIGGKNVSGTVGDISPYLRNVTNERVVLRADYAMHNAAILKSGVAYVPYEFFHQMQIISPPLLKGFSVQCHQDGISDKAPLLLPLSLNDLIVLSRKSTDGADLSAADFSGFLGEETANGRPMYRYEIDDTYYVTLDTRDGCFIPWLNNSSRGDAINIAACYYDGSPWWYTAE